MSIRSTLEALRKKVTKTVIEKAGEYATSFVQKNGPQILETALEKGLIPKQVTDLFGQNENLSTLLSLFSGTDNLNRLLAQLNSDSPAAQFLASEKGKVIAQQAASAGEGFAQQLLYGVGEKAYQEWLDNNPIPLSPNEIPQTTEQKSEVNPEYYLCEFCRAKTEQKHTQCPNCNASNGMVGYKHVENPAWKQQQHKLVDWLRKSKNKQKELGVDGSSVDLTAQQIGAALALIGSGSMQTLTTILKPEKTDTGPTGKQIVAASLQEKHDRSRVVADETDYKLKDLDPQIALQALEIHAQNTMTFERFIQYKGNYLAKSVTLESRSAVKGNVIALGDCWLKSNDIEITGVLVVMGKLRGFPPKSVETIYLVNDPRVSIETTCQPRAAVTKTSIDRVYQLAKQWNLLK